MTTTSKIYPLILCGGSGTRLWPLSREEQPKQFQPINGVGSLTFFQETIQRHRGGFFANPIVSVATRHLKVAARQLHEVQCKAHIIAEPLARNTGPAVLAAALHVGGADPDAVLIVLPSDHVIDGDLNALVLTMHKAAHDGFIVTFGIRPTFPETGYGYIMDGGAFDNYAGLHRVERFVEKPELPIARSLFETGFAYWASGISMFRADKIVAEYRRHDPQTYEAVLAATNAAMPLEDHHGIVLSAAHFANAVSLPTEKAVFERTADIALAPANIGWDDVGAWSALHAIGAKCKNGNVTSGDVMLHDTTESLVRGGDRLVAVVGMSDVIIVDTDDALLVASKQQAQDVKKIVEKLVASRRSEATSHRRQQTDWGSLKPMHSGTGFSMNLMTIDPGKQARIVGGRHRSHIVTVLAGSVHLKSGAMGMPVHAGNAEMFLSSDFALVSNYSDLPAELIEITCEVGLQSTNPLSAQMTGSVGVPIAVPLTVAPLGGLVQAIGADDYA